jgi:hypothetical protein
LAELYDMGWVTVSSSVSKKLWDLNNLLLKRAKTPTLPVERWMAVSFPKRLILRLHNAPKELLTDIVAS